MKLATARVAYRGAHRLDITVKSAQGIGRVLAPTWAMVMAHKAGAITDGEYTEGYYRLMRYKYALATPTYNGRQMFDAILAMPRVVFCCYCAAGRFCHRHLAVEIISKIAASRGIEVICEGEIHD